MQKYLLCWQRIQFQVFIHRFIGAIAATAVFFQLPDMSPSGCKARLERWLSALSPQTKTPLWVHSAEAAQDWRKKHHSLALKYLPFKIEAR